MRAGNVKKMDMSSWLLPTPPHSTPFLSNASLLTARLCTWEEASDLHSHILLASICFYCTSKWLWRRSRRHNTAEPICSALLALWDVNCCISLGVLSLTTCAGTLKHALTYTHTHPYTYIHTHIHTYTHTHTHTVIYIYMHTHTR